MYMLIALKNKKTLLYEVVSFTVTKFGSIKTGEVIFYLFLSFQE